MIEYLSYGFMQRAIIAGVLVSVLSGLMGVLMVLRKASFFSDAVAHASLTGVALGILLGINPVLSAASYAVLVAIALPILRKSSRLPLDSLLGFVLPFSLGLGVVILSYLPGYQPELMSFLFGNILSVDANELKIVASLVVLVIGVWLKLKDKLILVAFDEVEAKVRGLNVEWLELWFNLVLALAVVVGIRIAGIVLVNALLVIPAVIMRMLARSLHQMLWLTPLLSLSLAILGILTSLFMDWPTGPSIAIVSGGAFIFAVMVRGLVK